MASSTARELMVAAVTASISPPSCLTLNIGDDGFKPSNCSAKRGSDTLEPSPGVSCDLVILYPRMRPLMSKPTISSRLPPKALLELPLMAKALILPSRRAG